MAMLQEEDAMAPKQGRALDNGPRYLFQLQSPLDTPKTIQELVCLSEPLVIVPPTGSIGGETLGFVIFYTPACQRIAAFPAPVEGTFYAYRTPAAKALTSTTIEPTLGIDATLPHRRLQPGVLLQEAYAVPYFFYGYARLCRNPLSGTRSR
jgi:hypothetical protein